MTGAKAHRPGHHRSRPRPARTAGIQTTCCCYRCVPSQERSSVSSQSTNRSTDSARTNPELKILMAVADHAGLALEHALNDGAHKPGTSQPDARTRSVANAASESTNRAPRQLRSTRRARLRRGKSRFAEDTWVASSTPNAHLVDETRHTPPLTPERCIVARREDAGPRCAASASPRLRSPACRRSHRRSQTEATMSKPTPLSNAVAPGAAYRAPAAERPERMCICTRSVLHASP